jgi:putative transposase
MRKLGGVAKIVGGTADHVHMLVGLKATHNLADVMKQVKANSSKWIRDCIDRSFWGWQDGYGAFSVSHWDIEKIKGYIQRQKEHHSQTSFKDEYMRFLRESGVEFDERYLW